MGDTLDETPPTRRDKPHTLNIGQEEESSTAAPAGATASSIAIPAARSPRNRMRHTDRDAKRDHSSDGLVSSGNRRDEFTGLEAQPRRESLNSCEASSPVALSTSLGKAGRLSSAGSTRYPSGGGGGSASSSGIGLSVLGGVLGGTTTRKCVLTLDGYSYVIVASTPESLPSKRDEASVGAGATGGSSGAASGISGSAGAASGAASGLAGSGSGSATGAGGAGGISTPGQEAASPTVAELSGSSGPNATINGQVARHGSLTIIRRTNSRNFNQNDGQQLASPSAANSSGTASGISFAQTPISEPLAERLSFRTTGGSNGPASAGDSRSSNQGSSSSGAAATTVVATVAATVAAAAANKMQPSSPNSTNYAADNLQNSSANLSQTESGDHTANHSLNALGTGSFLRGDTDIPTTSEQSYETTSIMSFNAGQWETESLPPVDTPDALNKAALRIRSLLRRMDHETVPYEDMQRNLHYAARVLEAVFIDESRSPTSGKTRLGQIASSSVESEEEDCNGDCKNLSCSRHSHGRDPDQQQDNNNSNSSCSLKKVEEGKQEQKEEMATGDNQASIEGRTKGVSQAPQTHSGPTGPPATTSSLSDLSASPAPAATKLQPALETVRESVLEENSSKVAAPASTSTSTTTASATVSAAAAPATASAASTDPSGKAAESVASGSSSSSGNPATVHRQRRLRTPTWARSMSTNKTYLKFDF